MDGEQTQITGDRVGEGAVAAGCEWCGEPSKHSFPISRRVKGGKAGAVVPTGTHSYACDVHRELAEKDAEVIRPSLRKK